MMKKRKRINFMIYIILVIIIIPTGCSKGKEGLGGGRTEKRSKSEGSYESPFGYVYGEDSITNKVDKKIVKIIKRKLIPDRKMIDLIVQFEKNNPDKRKYWFIFMDKEGRIYWTLIDREGWFDKEGNPLPTRKLIDRWYIKERLSKMTNKEIETNIDIIRYYRIIRKRPIGELSTNLYLLGQHLIGDIPKVEVPIYIRKVPNEPNTNILIATIGFNRREIETEYGFEFPDDIKANFYVYEVENGKAKRVYEDLRCGDGLLKNGLGIERDREGGINVYLFVELGETWDVFKYVLRNSKEIKKITCEDDGDGDPYTLDGEDALELKKRFNAIDINP